MNLNSVYECSGQGASPSPDLCPLWSDEVNLHKVSLGYRIVQTQIVVEDKLSVTLSFHVQLCVKELELVMSCS